MGKDYPIYQNDQPLNFVKFPFKNFKAVNFESKQIKSCQNQSLAFSTPVAMNRLHTVKESEENNHTILVTV